MIDFQKPIKKEDTLELIEYFIQNKFDVKAVLKGQSGKLVDTGSRLIFEPYPNQFVKEVLVDYCDTVIKAVLVYAAFDVNLEGLKSVLGDYRKVYVPFDENFELHFKSELDSRLTIKTFMPDNKYSGDAVRIYNLQLLW